MKKQLLLALILALIAALALAGCAPDTLPVSADDEGFVWPVSGFVDVYNDFSDSHGGIDISGAEIHGAPVRAIAAGRVTQCVYSYETTGYGVYCIVEHEAGYTSLYAHLEYLEISAGCTVERGQILGYVGSTGESTGYHLHLEVLLDGVRIDPMTVLK